MNNQPQQNETTLNELMDFLQENMATKQDLKELRDDFGLDLGKQKHELMDYTDARLEKLRSDIHGDIITQSRKEDAKLAALIEILTEKNVL